MGDIFRNGYIVHRMMMGLYFSDALLYRFLHLMKRVYR
jgi:hypothetical protein